MEFAVIGASRITGHPSTLRPSSTIILIVFFVLAVATSQSIAHTFRPTADTGFPFGAGTREPKFLYMSKS